ncbi:MAG: helix-turn-helix domain-containing protein [bacterium]
MKEIPTKELRAFVKSAKVMRNMRLLRTVCGPIRFKVIALLKKHPEGLSVSQLAEILDSSLSKISHQLRPLREAKLIAVKHKNREVIYALANHRIEKLLSF